MLLWLFNCFSGVKARRRLEDHRTVFTEQAGSELNLDWISREWLLIAGEFRDSVVAQYPSASCEACISQVSFANFTFHSHRWRKEMSLMFCHFSPACASKWRSSGVFESRRGTVSPFYRALRAVLIDTSEWD